MVNLTIFQVSSNLVALAKIGSSHLFIMSLRAQKSVDHLKRGQKWPQNKQLTSFSKKFKSYITNIRSIEKKMKNIIIEKALGAIQIIRDTFLALFWHPPPSPVTFHFFNNCFLRLLRFELSNEIEERVF